MAAANDQQVQQYIDERIRPAAERTRAIKVLFDDLIASIDDVYDAVEPPEQATWEDSRDDVPHKLTPEDVIAINSFINDIRNAIQNNPQYSIVMKACVRGIEV